MKNSTRNAFTVLELVFVIVIIGILSAIALPKFRETSVIAHTAKAGSELAAVRSALSTERQKRILRGDSREITSLGNVFTNFSAAADNSKPKVLQYPPTACSSTGTACWTNNDRSYIYTFADTGSASFILRNNRLECNNDASDCARLEN